jgi:hypothetical protein
MTGKLPSPERPCCRRAAERRAAVSAHQAIREAERLPPGEPVTEGLDPRWQAIIAVGEFINSEPDAIRGFIQRWGRHPQKDLRDAIATCLLEELLARHFAAYFPLVEELALGDSDFAETFLRCWEYGQAEETQNSKQFRALRKRLRPELY